ncbi:type II secretion system protein C (GspC) [Persephonella hydrogeniphila]|uniref:Type II secretion system protein C (GspC) n=1 Tax=Persephonella hydrogeniphila TaxID=198703 RepID=A0A285NAJ4_9AQUI|nr:type II secretion system protein GspC [Persephonella hydrogeniphila]SNZ06459.1 type II secretion system protein C (GspC) [Persephonella hydrogeniphila]
MEVLVDKIKVDKLFLVLLICVAGFSAAYTVNSYLSSYFFSLPDIKDIENSKKSEKLTKDYRGLYYLFPEKIRKKQIVSSVSADSLNRSDSTDLKLLGVVIAKNSKVAFLKSKSGVVPVKEGDSIDGYKVKHIRKRDVVLQSGTEEYIITLEPAEIKLSDTGRSVKSMMSEEIVKVDRRFIQEKTADIGNLLKDVLLVPEIKNGETIGFRFRYIKPKSVLYRLGLRSGDLIISVNDMPVRTAEEAFKIYNMLRNEEYVKVVIERRGKRKVLTYEIR